MKKINSLKLPILLAILIAGIGILAFVLCSKPDSNSLTLNGMVYGDQAYKTVKIGSQIWMAENLNYKAPGSKCYDGDSSNCAKYGRLYDWQTAITVCPPGWHLPSNADWEELFHYVDSQNGLDSFSVSPYDSPTGGKHLKAAKGWDCGNGTDKYNFSALPCGYEHSNGDFREAGYICNWWSSLSDDSSNIAYGRFMGCSHDKVLGNYFNKSFLFAVRCLQD